MGPRTNRVAGSALVPLPYESSMSALWRFGWRNSLKSAQLKGLCSDNLSYPAADCVRSGAWVNTEKLRAISGWTVPTAEEVRFARALRNDHGAWINTGLRYCPLCLELGYHSFLHQLAGISSCPLHGVPLAHRCHSCGAGLPLYRHAPVLYDRPYRCVCGQPISGVAPDLVLDDMLRAQRGALEEAFGPVMRWWEESAVLRAQAARFSSTMTPPGEHLRQWCDVPAFIRSLTLLRAPPPDCFDAPAVSAITVLRWRVCIATDIPAPAWPQPRRSWQERVRIPAAVYRCVLRGLQRWVCRHEQWSEAQLFAALLAQSERVRDFRPRLLALLCLRRQFEERMWEGGPWDPNPHVGQLRDAPEIDLNLYQGRTIRVAWRAAFLALYASWYFRVLKSVNESVSVLKFYHRGESDCFLYWSAVEAERERRWWTGAVAFPTIDDLHLLVARRIGSDGQNWPSNLHIA
jgi:hypothetical protein